MNRAIRGCSPSGFAVTMGTGIVSAAWRLAGVTVIADVLLAIAAASFAVLVAGSVLRLALFRANVRADLTDPSRAFSAFAFVAACDVLGSDLASVGRRGFAAALAILAGTAWAVLTVLVPARLAVRAQPFPLPAVGGSWYLWVVGAQSLAIAVTSAGRGGAVARAVALAAWITGMLLYAAVSNLVLLRLRRVGLARTEPTAPYWISMGAASISVLAGAELLGPAWTPSGSGRTAMTWITVSLWLLASCLIVPPAARSAWRHLVWREPLRYRTDLWMVVFPCGMYATASMRLATTAHLPVAGTIGRVAVWPAALGWAVVFAAMAASWVITGSAASRSPTRLIAPHGTGPPILDGMNEPARHGLRDDADDRPGDPPCLQRRVCPACGSVADEDPPTTCPTCGADMPGE